MFVQVPTSKLYRNVRDYLYLEHCAFHTFFREPLFLPLRMLDSFPFPVFSFSLVYWGRFSLLLTHSSSELPNEKITLTGKVTNWQFLHFLV